MDETKKIERHYEFDNNQFSGKRFAKENDPFRFLETKDPLEYWWNPVSDSIPRIYDTDTALCFCSMYAQKLRKVNLFCFVDYNQSCKEFSQKIKEARNILFQDFGIDVDDDYWRDRFYPKYKKSKEEVCSIYGVDASQADWKELIFELHPAMRRFCKGT